MQYKVGDLDIMDFLSNIDTQVITNLTDLERTFLGRVYAGDFDRYIQRINQIQFVDIGKVLDAGAGFGQWSIALSLNRNQVYALDSEINNCQVLSQIVNKNNIPVQVIHGKLEELPFEDNFFDGIFSYSVLYFTNYQISLEEIYRVLKPSGRCYLNTNDLGWYIYLLFSKHNATQDYNPRLYALKSILNTYFGLSKDFSIQNGSQFIPKKRLIKRLRSLGFKIIDVKGDGMINCIGNSKGIPFFKDSFLGIPATYEILIEKP
jgi:ubiquinone/menaquinone biosynthesis C-methylase UbiE